MARLTKEPNLDLHLYYLVGSEGRAEVVWEAGSLGLAKAPRTLLA